MTCGGALLTGGSSRRLGVDKATLVVGGERLADRAARVLGAGCRPLVEIGPGVTRLSAVRDDPAGAGPLGALVAAAAALGTRGPIVVLACDLPFVESPLVELLARWPGLPTAIPIAAGEPQTVCARYGPAALAAARVAFATGERSLRALLEGTDHDQIPESEWRAVAPAHAFLDVDTPADLERVERLTRPAEMGDR